MKNIRAYLTTAGVSLMLVVVSAFAAGDVGLSSVHCVPLLFGLFFSWSAVKAVIAGMEEDDRAVEAARFTRPTLKAA